MFTPVRIHNVTLRGVRQALEADAALLHEVAQFASHLFLVIVVQEDDVVSLPKAHVVSPRSHELFVSFCRVITISEENVPGAREQTETQRK